MTETINGTYETEEINENRAILIGLQRNEDITHAMDELKELAEAAGLETMGTILQKKDKVTVATFIGKGKLEEAKEACEALEVDTVIFNDELSGSQIRNIEAILEVRVIDRTILILDIFASRAKSREGRLQVELAQLQYRLPRLVGFGKSLSRLGGGVGTRGPGETKLETDRRHIAKRLDDIRKELEAIKKTRQTQRIKREKSDIPIVALVGYTNSGKSTVMNYLLKFSEKEEKQVFAEDMLFATLDTFQRSITLESNESFLLIDTVGFVSHLPHALVNAFKATLDEVLYADLLLHVVDAAYSEADFCIQITESVLKDLGASDKETLILFNKIDLVEDAKKVVPMNPDHLFISAKTGINMDLLMKKIREKIFSDREEVELLIPYDQGQLNAYLCEKCQVIDMEHKEDGTYFKVVIGSRDIGSFNPYRIK